MSLIQTVPLGGVEFGEKASAEDVAAAKAAFQPESYANLRLWEIYDEDGVEIEVGEVRKTIDGVKKKKPVYKNFILIPSLPSSAGSQTYTSDITNADDIINFYGYAFFSDTNSIFFMPVNMCRRDIIDQIGCFMFIENNIIKTSISVGYSRDNSSGKIFVYYTKTTDEWQPV